MSTSGCGRQFNTHRVRIPSVGCSEEGNLIQCQQLNGNTARLGGSQTAPLSSPISRLSLGDRIFKACREKGSALSETKCRGLIDKSPPPAPDWSIVMQMRALNPHSLLIPKGTVLIGQSRIALIGQRRTALFGWETPLCYWLKQDPGTPLSGMLSCRTQCRRAAPGQQVGERPLGSNG